LFAIIACSATTVFAGVSSLFQPAALAPKPIAGDYVEARSASVFCGACHYNAELMTTGRDAVMAWNFTDGTWHGVSLKGLRAVAATTADDSLGYPESHRTAELAVDSSATPEQVNAVRDLLTAKCGTQIGQIVKVVSAPISFHKSETGYLVSAPGFAALDVAYRADDSCCKMPNFVWFDPLSNINHRMVGYTQNAEFSGDAIAQPWSRQGEDGAFYGTIAF
jgi:hypothetical protein